MDNIRHKFELLKMARELLNEEYINRRAEDHNKWVAECDVAWKTRGVKLPYPPFAPYPTEAEIIAKATSLYSFLGAEEAAAEVPAALPVTAVTDATEFAIEISKGPPWNVQLPLAATEPATVEEPVHETKVESAAEPIVVPTPVVTTVDIEPEVEVPVAEPVTKTIVPEPKPLFAVPSWLQKIQK